MVKSEAEINAEKAGKLALDLVPPEFAEAAAEAFAYGEGKHGLADNGRGTYRVAGTEQARVRTHVQSMLRHLNAIMAGEHYDPESGLPHWSCFSAQAAIVLSLIRNPPGGKHDPADARWIPPAGAADGEDLWEDDDAWALPDGWAWSAMGVPNDRTGWCATGPCTIWGSDAPYGLDPYHVFPEDPPESDPVAESVRLIVCKRNGVEPIA